MVRTVGFHRAFAEVAASFGSLNTVCKKNQAGYMDRIGYVCIVQAIEALQIRSEHDYCDKNM